MKMFLSMVLAATSAGSVLLAADTVVEDDIADQALAIEVKSGDTITYSGVISGTSSIMKGGDGILILHIDVHPRNHADHRDMQQVFQHLKPRFENLHVTPEFVDDDALDARLFVLVE